MPRRGYRKGVSDRQVPVPRRMHTRLPEAVHADLMADAGRRGRPAASLIRALVVAHYAGKRLELPHPRSADAELLHEWNRLGNNLNQIARQAHLMRLHQLEGEARACLAAIRGLVDRRP